MTLQEAIAANVLLRVATALGTTPAGLLAEAEKLLQREDDRC
jgi:hypothetical protein